VRGSSLREFVNFLNENDPGLKDGKQGTFAGLQRLGDPEDGTAIWTTLTDPAEVKAAIEARAKERRGEQRAAAEALREELKPQHNEAAPLQGGSNALVPAQMPRQGPSTTAGGGVVGASNAQLEQLQAEIKKQSDMMKHQAEMIEQLHAMMQESPARRSGLLACFMQP